MTSLRIGVFGLGMISQIEHVPNLLKLKDKFEIVAGADPSPAARSFMEEQFGMKTCAGLDELLNEKLDALLVASPDFTHVTAVRKGLEAGLHVFTEKPLGYGSQDFADLIALRDAKNRVVQVGYMKRFDASYEMALQELPGDASRLRYVAVEVNEADAAYHTAQHRQRQTGDLSAEALAAGRAAVLAQTAAALGREVDPLTFKGFISAYSSSIVHDVNIVHGMLDHLGVDDLQPIGAEIFAGGDGGAGMVRMNNGHSLWQMVHVKVPKLADYRERVAFYFDDSVIELVFPSPYLNHQQTELIVQRSTGHRFGRSVLRNGYQEAYIRQMEGFWSAAVEGTKVRNTIEHARKDQDLLCDLGRLAARHRDPA
ncbi:Gfo/Idh/MocA family oxidoreductase [Mesorhizobium sp. KR1-2]|uniref:Gfo/Idh/MocA family protein n=1 Tax=Mesorhizobium sp. KR1-2 TaxID=3156609 RepID=UPI0032B319FA